jgi:EAL domain-containing protein (putative c-di-GMP-specific phosphodiesterase class I)
VHGSIGIAVYPGDGDGPAELLRAADTAMYRAKDEGGDRFLYFTSEMSNEVLAIVKLEGALRQALARNEFMLHYQPIREFSSGEVRGAEALLRWQSPGTGNVPPSVFIPVAERTGLIVPIGSWVLDAACAQHAIWSELRLPPLRINVNVSARQFRSPDLEESIARALETDDVPPDRLNLELTESMLMEKPTESAGILGRLKDLGIGLSLDDFGTGFSSLAYLSRFPVDILKIDGSFVRSLEKDESARKIITSIIELAQGLGMRTVAEGVETEAQERFLKDLGCDAFQGYIFSKPLPPADFVAFLSARGLGKGAAGAIRKKRARAR